MADRIPEAGEALRVCQRTGLSLVAVAGVRLWRVARYEYGPVKPPLRHGGDVEDWSRFDVDRRGTLYAASTPAGAYAECLAPLRPTLHEFKFGEMFDDLEPGEDPVGAEWLQQGFMRPGQIPRQWRADRCLAELDVTSYGWAVDVDYAPSLAALRGSLGPYLATLGIRDVDGSMIRSENRRATVAVAEWLAIQVLDDGSEPLGVRFRSRLGDDYTCWALWTDRDGHVPAREVSREDILTSDPAFRHVCQLWGLWPF